MVTKQWPPQAWSPISIKLSYLMPTIDQFLHKSLRVYKMQRLSKIDNSLWIIAYSGQTSPPGVGRWWTLRCMGSRSRSRSPSLFTNCTGTRNASKGSLSQEFCLFGRRTSVYIWVCIDAQRERISESTFRTFLKRNPYQKQYRHSITLTELYFVWCHTHKRNFSWEVLNNTLLLNF